MIHIIMPFHVMHVESQQDLHILCLSSVPTVINDSARAVYERILETIIGEPALVNVVCVMGVIEKD